MKIPKGGVNTPITIIPQDLYTEKLIYAIKLRLIEMGPNNGIAMKVHDPTNPNKDIIRYIKYIEDKNGKLIFKDTEIDTKMLLSPTKPKDG